MVYHQRDVRQRRFHLYCLASSGGRCFDPPWRLLWRNLMVADEAGRVEPQASAQKEHHPKPVAQIALPVWSPFLQLLAPTRPALEKIRTHPPAPRVGIHLPWVDRPGIGPRAVIGPKQRCCGQTKNNRLQTKFAATRLPSGVPEWAEMSGYTLLISVRGYLTVHTALGNLNLDQQGSRTRAPEGSSPESRACAPSVETCLSPP